jgi:putative DNA primase/helicase
MNKQRSNFHTEIITKDCNNPKILNYCDDKFTLKDDLDIILRKNMSDIEDENYTDNQEDQCINRNSDFLKALCEDQEDELSNIPQEEKKFRKILYGDLQEGVFCLSTLPDKKTYTFDVTDDKGIDNYIEQLKHTFDVYYRVCLLKDYPEAGKRGDSKNSLVMPGLWFDLDVFGPNHKEKALPTEEQAYKLLEEIGVEPTMLVSSGGGLHVYYLFNKPLIFKDEKERDMGARLSDGFQRYILELGRKHDWKIDPTYDLARILRVPGTYNLKNDQKVEVKIISINNEKRYEPSYFEKFINNEEKVSRKKSSSTAASEVRRPALISPIERGCAWMRHCKEDAKSLPEPEWVAMLSILGRCLNGEALAHEWSSPYKKYSRDETEYKLSHALKAGPRTCKNICEALNGEKEYCSQCLSWGKISSPINLGDQKADLVKDFRNTDMGNADRLHYLFGNDLRYCTSNNTWLVWNDTGWRYDFKNVEIQDRAKRMIQQYRISAGNDNKALKYSNTLESSGKLKNMIELLKSYKDICISADECDHDKWLFTCENGVIDLKTGLLRDARKSDLITLKSGVKYDPEAKCPIFLKYLDEVIDGNQELIDYLQRVVGYSLTGDIREHCIFCLYGTGANGKSTFVEVIRKLMGVYAMNASFQTFLLRAKGSHTEDLARLKDARLVTASEPDKKSGYLAEAVIKEITGGEPVTARFMHKNSFEYNPKCKIFLSFNHRPQISGNDHGIWRRIHLIPFNVTISEDRMDRSLEKKLLTELSGILNWAIEGCQKWQKSGLNPPEIVKNAVKAYRYSQDTVTWFKNEMIEKKAGSNISKEELYQHFIRFCDNNDEKCISKIAFGKRLKELNIIDDRSSITRYWTDISLKQ